MKKIGILTFQKTSSNYGAALQCFALYKFLDAKSFKCEVIDLLRPEHKGFKESILYPKPKINKYEWSKVLNAFKRRLNFIYNRQKESKIISTAHTVNRISNFNGFNSQINYSITYISIDEIYNQPPLYDYFIVGSDQVWNPDIGFNITPYFLNFVKGKSKKISYAASLGIDKISKRNVTLFKSLEDFHAISVREQEGKKALKKIINNKIKVVLDPVFLLDKEQWTKLIEPIPPLDLPYIFVYSVAENKELIDFASELGIRYNLKVIVTLSVPPKFNHENILLDVDAGPKEWLNYLSKSELILTDSFHGLAFSIIFNKPFYIYIANKKRSSRIINLLKSINMTDRIIRPKQVNFDEIGKSSIDYSEINNKMSGLRLESKKFLEVSLA